MVCSASSPRPKTQQGQSEKILDHLIELLSCREAQKTKMKAQSLRCEDSLKEGSKQQLRIGINSVTKRLEAKLRGAALDSTVSIIFVCRRDMLPQQICSHLLLMAAMTQAKLVQLPQQSEQKLSTVLGMKAAQLSVILLELSMDDLEPRTSLLRLAVEDIPFIDAPWLGTNLKHYLPFKFKAVQGNCAKS
ncbi:hypothetical protein BC940DRAFT_140959 [Gongronella butleri]|nr:hypothetical protein BC940DRAFT_140959 [Gongronella butleri]